jgi:transposase
METEMNTVTNSSNMESRTLPVGHLGLISTFFNEFGIIQLVDRIIPKEREHKVTHGESLLALMLVGFSFYRRALYTVNEEMKSLPLSLLFGRNIDYTDFNDDVLGRLFEAINDYGPTEFFTQVVSHISNIEPDLIKSNVYHADTTNFTLYGDYNEPNENNNFRVTYGHPKDGRDRFKIFTLFLLSNPNGVPVFMEELSGNSSDNKVIAANVRAAMKTMYKNIQNHRNLYFVSDAAFYSKENIQDFGANFITRVPVSIKIASELIASDTVEMKKIEGDDRYSWDMITSDYGEVNQHWFLISSTEMQKLKERTFNKRLNKLMTAGKKDLKSISKQPFACEEDARREAARWSSKHELIVLANVGIEERETIAKGKPGRPKNDEPRQKQYFITGEVELDEEAVQSERLKLGRFILATNDLEATAEEVLKLYKEQGMVEKDFRFLKGNDFRIKEVLLKSTRRIQGFCCFMALMLLVYSLLELKLRNGLKKNNECLLNKSRKPYLKPTLLHAIKEFKYFYPSISFNDSLSHIKVNFPINDRPNEYIRRVLRALGEPYLKFYSFKSDFLSDTDNRIFANYIYNNFEMEIDN